jgi:hypothetical protein
MKMLKLFWAILLAVSISPLYCGKSNTEESKKETQNAEIIAPSASPAISKDDNQASLGESIIELEKEILDA